MAGLTFQYTTMQAASRLLGRLWIGVPLMPLIKFRKSEGPRATDDSRRTRLGEARARSRVFRCRKDIMKLNIFSF